MTINYIPWATSNIIDRLVVIKKDIVPQISIILTTDYIGGLDILFDSLKNQTIKEFELILVDSLYKYRKNIVLEKSKYYDFNIKHIEPNKNIFPIFNYCNSINTGLINVLSKYVLLIKNYTYLPENCIEKHLNFHLACPAENIGLMCPEEYKVPPKLNIDIIKYNKEDIDIYANDLKENKLNNNLWSIFSNIENNIEILPIDNSENIDKKLSIPFSEGASDLFNGNNTSFKLEAALKVNGFDEEMDGTNFIQDNLFADLLSKKLEFTWMVDKNNKVFVINTKSILPQLKKLRSENINLNILQEKKLNNFKDKINNYSLKMVRNNLLSKSKKTRISVLVPTNRAGGLDVLFEGLKNQSFQDFELILVDALYNARKKIVAEKSKQYNFAVKHIEPINNTFPVSNYCASINTGLINAEGELVYFTCDYAYLDKDTLLTHHQFHRNTPRDYGLLAPIDVCEFDHKYISDKFPMERQYGTRGEDKKYQLLTVPEEVYVSAHNKWSDDYAEDIAIGKLDQVLWCIFNQEIGNDNSINNIISSTTKDTKFNNLSKEITMPVFHDFCCLKNDSFKLNFIMQVGGMNEELDGSHGFQDSEIGRQIKNVYNGKFFAIDKSPVSVINTRYYLEPRKIIKGYNNIKIIDREYINPKPRVNEIIKKYRELNDKV